MRTLCAKPLLLLATLLTILSLTACASLGPPSSGVSLEVISEPPGVEITLRGRKMGRAPLALEVGSLQEVVEVSVATSQPPLMERRIKLLGPDSARVTLLLSDQPTELARRLGLSRIVTFDYDERATFDLESAELKDSFLPTLDRQASLLAEFFSGVPIYVCGHTDNSGSDDLNGVLSLNRARAVSDYLISRDIEASRLKVQGFGPDYPLTSNSTAAGRALNRRTEIVLPD